MNMKLSFFAHVSSDRLLFSTLIGWSKNCYVMISFQYAVKNLYLGSEGIYDSRFLDSCC